MQYQQNLEEYWNISHENSTSDVNTEKKEETTLYKDIHKYKVSCSQGAFKWCSLTQNRKNSLGKP